MFKEIIINLPFWTIIKMPVYTLFFDKAHGLGGASRTIRKFKKKVKDNPPPANNSKITDHFKPNPASNEEPNEPKINLRRKPGEKL